MLAKDQETNAKMHRRVNGDEIDDKMSGRKIAGKVGPR